jgi:hypothetical protein
MNYAETIVGSFTLKHTRVKSVRADLLAGSISVTFVVTLDEESLRAGKHLQHLFGDDDVSLDLTVTEKRWQPLRERTQGQGSRD